VFWLFLNLSEPDYIYHFPIDYEISNYNMTPIDSTRISKRISLWIIQFLVACDTLFYPFSVCLLYRLYQFSIANRKVFYFQFSVGNYFSMVLDFHRNLEPVTGKTFPVMITLLSWRDINFWIFLNWNICRLLLHFYNRFGT